MRAPFLRLPSCFSSPACALLSFHEGSFDVAIAAYSLGATLLMLLGYNLAAIIFRHIDRITLVICFFLASVGLVMLARLDMEIAVKQLIFLAGGCIIMFITVTVIRRTHDFGKLNYLFMAAAIGLLMFALVFGKSQGGAKNWVSIAGISFQPSEFAKILFIINAAYFPRTATWQSGFRRIRSVFRSVRHHPCTLQRSGRSNCFSQVHF